VYVWKEENQHQPRELQPTARFIYIDRYKTRMEMLIAPLL